MTVHVFGTPEKDALTWDESTCDAERDTAVVFHPQAASTSGRGRYWSFCPTCGLCSFGTRTRATLDPEDLQ